MKKFKTITEDVSAEIEEKKSKFIANIFYIDNEEQAQEKLKQIKKKYWDAKHHCYAYQVMQEGEIKIKAVDDGEPTGTAGAPILNIIKKNELYNIIIIVTRYFGGTLLGTGGLIRAYTEASQKALEKTGLATQEEGEKIEIIIPYSQLEKFKYYCSKNEIEIIELNYENEIKCQILINKEEKEKLIKKGKETLKILEYKGLEKKYIKKKIKE